MPVNYGILQQIQAPGASERPVELPQNNAPSPADTLAGGIMQGFQQGQSNKMEQEKIDQNKTMLDQNQQKINQDQPIADMNALKLKQAQESYAASKGSDADWLASLDPGTRTLELTNRAKLAQANQDLAKGNLAVSTTTADLMASPGSAALKVKDPQQAQQVYQTGISMLPPVLQKQMPAQFSQNDAINRISVASDLHMKYMQDTFGAGKDATQTDKEKNITFYNNRISELQNKIKDAKASGQDTADLQQELNTYQQGNQQQIDPQAKAAAGKGGDTILTSSEGRKDFFQLRGLSRAVDQATTTLNMADAQMKDISSNDFNPYTGSVSAKFQAKQEVINKNLNQLVLQAPSLFGLSGSSLRLGSVWNLIQNAKPNPEMWVTANRAVIADLKYNAAIQAHKTWADQSEQMKAQALGDNPTAVKESALWFKDHPDPLASTPQPDFTELYKMFPSVKNLGLEKDWADVASAPLPDGSKSGTSQTQEYTPTKGDTVTDSKGNKAQYLGGDPKSASSYKEIP